MCVRRPTSSGPCCSSSRVPCVSSPRWCRSSSTACPTRSMFTFASASTCSVQLWALQLRTFPRRQSRKSRPPVMRSGTRMMRPRKSTLSNPGHPPPRLPRAQLEVASSAVRDPLRSATRRSRHGSYSPGSGRTLLRCTTGHTNTIQTTSISIWWENRLIAISDNCNFAWVYCNAAFHYIAISK